MFYYMLRFFGVYLIIPMYEKIILKRKKELNAIE